MILLHNRVRKYAVDEASIRHDTQIIMRELGYQDFDIGILLTTDATIRTYNREYRHKDKPTDILSFPYYPELKAGERIKAQSDEDKNLGDIIISIEYVRRDAAKLGVTFEQRMKRLLVHGICHLLGYDHIKDEDYRVMLKKEMALLKKL